MNLPLNTNFDGKVCVITGGGGLLCSMFAQALASAGAKVAILDLNGDAAKTVADKINENGGTAISISTNVLEKESLENAKKIVNEKLGSVDILLNGAGGNNPKGSTTKDYYEIGDENLEDVKSFFDLDPQGVGFVFNLNFL